MKYKERRTINVDKVSYDTIKSYCIKNALDMPKWIVKVIIEKIETSDICQKN